MTGHRIREIRCVATSVAMAETNAGVHVDTVRMQARSLVEPMRNDLYLTSTGRGHEVRPTSDFPPADHKVMHLDS